MKENCLEFFAKGKSCETITTHFCIPKSIWFVNISPALKGQCHEIFDPRLFYQSAPPRALIHRLKPFCIWLRWEIRDNRLKSASAVSMRLPKPLQQFQWGPEADLVVSMRPWKRIQRLQWDSRSSFGGFNETTESIKKIFNNIIFTQKGSFQHKTTSKKVWLKGIRRSQWDRGSRSGWKWIQRCQWDRGSGFSSLNVTAESFCDTAETLVKTNFGSQFL
jgi:hypothetical protein